MYLPVFVVRQVERRNRLRPQDDGVLRPPSRRPDGSRCLWSAERPAQSWRCPGQPESVTEIEKGTDMDPTRKLYRSRSDRKLAGVCGGLAQFFGLDPTLIRVLFVVLAVLGGSGILIYLAMWIMVPNEYLLSSGGTPR
jgi:phage shock protein C